ncbi:HMG domain-containing protein [Coccidioides immitis RS]|uniref:HMG domain-containing protein n=2 Tax=Coccidioides immitis TaxID=5501 RepID=J3KGY2_COCIM|nr:HMG domain-containing protein [Coccidioides immitis RS]EAS35052.3 HMG domain-containing protein [Coccidioides immitis RS]KMP00267.1 mating type HMG-box protein [Coccidioides immitis RMSCC 2394]
MAAVTTAGFQPMTGSKDLVVELIWQHAVNHLKKTKNEIFLPVDIISLIGGDNVEKIKNRLSTMLNMPVVAFEDHANNVYRIMPTPALDGAIESTVAQILPMMATGSHSPQNLGEKLNKQNVSVKAAKVPRPPNAFILYRQHHHPLIKAAHPEYHNNDISILLGKKWKLENAETKAHFKALADKIKRKHAEDHPDYQYAPRKPSEKKRRSVSRRDGFSSKNIQLDTFSPQISTFGNSVQGTQMEVDFCTNVVDASQSLDNNDDQPATPVVTVQYNPGPEMIQDTSDFIMGLNNGGFLTLQRRLIPSTSASATVPASNSATSNNSNEYEFDMDDYFIPTE